MKYEEKNIVLLLTIESMKKSNKKLIIKRVFNNRKTVKKSTSVLKYL